MPVVKTVKINDKSTYALWEIAESVEELTQQAMSVSSIQLPDVEISNELKKKEWIAGRLLIRTLLQNIGEDYYGIYKDGFGKPFLRQLDYHISISHAASCVGAIVSDKPVGLDIEQPKGKLLKVAHKFLSDKEQKLCGDDLQMLCTCWCAKEALYKLYGRKRLIFKENLAVEVAKDQLIGKIIVNNTSEQHQLIAEKYRESILVYTV